MGPNLLVEGVLGKRRKENKGGEKENEKKMKLKCKRVILFSNR